MSQGNSFNAKKTLTVGDKTYQIYSLPTAETALGDLSRLPFCLKVLLENLLRHEDGRTVTADDVRAIAARLQPNAPSREIAYRPARVLMQDFTGVPAVVDLAAMRDAMVSLGDDPDKINPLSPVDLVIDHSVMVDVAGNAEAFEVNVTREFQRNAERYEFLRWGAAAFDNFRVVPPGTGICHQVNLEYLAQVVWTKSQGDQTLAYPDTVVGTDSHTTMINGLAVLGWGVGGIEAEAAMLGQPISMMIPEVVGFELTGELPEGATATDLVLTVTQMLRAQGVVGKFVEFYGDGLDHLSLADRATISNMAPEYGATCGFFPIDQETIDYLRFTGRDEDRVQLVEAYAKAQGMWRDAASPVPMFADTLALDLGTVQPSLAGPKRPQDRVLLADVARQFRTQDFPSFSDRAYDPAFSVPVADASYSLRDGDVVIAAITSCTNTSNPSVMLAAGLVARKARALGLAVKPWVKTSLAPGSQVVSDYLERAGLQEDLDALGFNLVGYGCTTCIGNSGPLPDPIVKAIDAEDLVVGAVLSGNRNFEGRVSPHTKANYLASPPLVVAYAIAGNLGIDLLHEPLGQGSDGQDIFLKDIWPSSQEIKSVLQGALTPQLYRSRYSNVFTGDTAWQKIAASESQTYAWQSESTYVQNPPFFTGMSAKVEGESIEDIQGARLLALLGDSITTDHISPAGAIKAASPAGDYLVQNNVVPVDFNSFGSRRGNHEVMMRGTFGNIRLRNELVPDSAGGVTRHMPEGTEMSIFDAAMQYQAEGVPLIVIAGKEYGTGSSRDWAAKGVRLLGVQAVIAESYERIHRSNLVGMGILPLQFPAGVNRKTLDLDGSELFNLTGLSQGLEPGMKVTLEILRSSGETDCVDLLCRIDTLDEVEYYRNGGILQYVLRQLLAA
ncbi:aconitate hydratase AcnA [Lyngbya confervoides]|uniref:Aconitate hydratase n=1 Tax=Lyngbya confervoides BDU141951 TaxID=1574623 RepID=A0ABD4T3T8_9CYAN|nr:aconitate hydratase AcnA [Lyngbya confervoides]MCM1983387.1 aconitate hydratase AcnA [Lyngbya confervoides BDU141951]